MGFIDAIGKLASKLAENVSEALEATRGGNWQQKYQQAISPHPQGKKKQKISFKGKTAVQAVNIERNLKVDPFDALYVFTEKHMKELFPPKEPGAKIGVLKMKYVDGKDELGNYPIVSIFRLTDSSPHVLVENISFASSHKTQIISGFGNQFLPIGFGKLPTQISLSLKALSAGNYAGGFTAEQMLHMCSTTNFGKFLTNREYFLKGKLSQNPCFYVCYLSYERMVYYYLTLSVSRAKTAQDQLFEYLGVQGIVLGQYQLIDSENAKKMEAWDKAVELFDPIQKKGGTTCQQ